VFQGYMGYAGVTLAVAASGTLSFAPRQRDATVGVQINSDAVVEPDETFSLDLSEITDAHIRAIQPPRNEKGWLDPIGWMGVYATRMIATALQVV